MYNVIFPLWMTVFMPPYLWLVLGGNLLIDALVILITLRLSRVKLAWKRELIFVISAWGFGFFADIIGAVYLFMVEAELEWVRHPLYEHLMSLWLYLFGIGLAGLLIFWFNSWFGKKLGLSPDIAKRVGLAMGIITAPWMFLLPPI
ncbi:MAG: hypothetical protein H0Z33_07830 [Bacillaceae bacterium]|nr:hypothetical protein [Bacillaceae bacterium]